MRPGPGWRPGTCRTYDVLELAGGVQIEDGEEARRGRRAARGSRRSCGRRGPGACGRCPARSGRRPQGRAANEAGPEFVTGALHLSLIHI
eukprot:15293736-Alexandrium_andersonii.AAC.1